MSCNNRTTQWPTAHHTQPVRTTNTVQLAKAVLKNCSVKRNTRPSHSRTQKRICHQMDERICHCALVVTLCCYQPPCVPQTITALDLDF